MRYVLSFGDVCFIIIISLWEAVAFMANGSKKDVQLAGFKTLILKFNYVQVPF